MIDIRILGAMGVAAFAWAALPQSAEAHTPLCSCYDNGDKILCEGGFSDGSSASNVPMRVVGADGKVLLEGKMNKLSEFEFKKPEGAYTVVFDGGEGHVIKIKHTDISK